MKQLKLSVEVTRRQLLRQLGYPRAKAPAPQVSEQLDELIPLARELIQPMGALRLVEGALAEQAGLAVRSPLVGLGLCTIGPALELEEQRRISRDRMLEALILDAYGSAAAEAAADALNFKLCLEAGKLDHHAGARSSPGYGSWDVRCQEPLLKLLDPGSLGVTLSQSMMMAPRKSVSFAARLRPGEGRPPEERARRCARCGMTDCAYREEE